MLSNADSQLTAVAVDGPEVTFNGTEVVLVQLVALFDALTTPEIASAARSVPLPEGPVVGLSSFTAGVLYANSVVITDQVLAGVLGSGSGEEDEECIAACTTATAAAATTVTAQTEASTTGTATSTTTTTSSSQVRR